MRMVTLSLIQQNPNFKQISSDRLFYDHWQYCIGFRLSEVSALRDGLDSESIDQVLDSRQSWRERVRTRWPQNNFVRGHDEITSETRENLYAFADFLQQTTDPYKMVISVNQCWVYSNQPNLLERIGRLPFVRATKFTQSVITRARNTVALKNPQYQYRSYFRSIKLTPGEKDQLINFFNNQPNIRISPALVRWLLTPFNRTDDYFFVDYNGTSWLTMLSLVRPGLIRKTSQLVAK